LCSFTLEFITLYICTERFNPYGRHLSGLKAFYSPSLLLVIVSPDNTPSIITTEIFGNADIFFIYHLDEYSDKSHCFNYVELVSVREIEGNLGTNVGIVPFVMDLIRTRNYCDNNDSWT